MLGFLLLLSMHVLYVQMADTGMTGSQRKKD